MEKSKQLDLFPDEERKTSGKGTPEFIARFQVRGRSSPPRYKRLEIPDWVRERSNRDTENNLE